MSSQGDAKFSFLVFSPGDILRGEQYLGNICTFIVKISFAWALWTGIGCQLVNASNLQSFEFLDYHFLAVFLTLFYVSGAYTNGNSRP